MNITTGKVRLSFCHVWQPQAPQGGGEPKYSVTMLIPKSDVETINRINAAIEEAKRQGVSSKWNGVMPPVVAIPLYDGDGVRPNGEPFGEECKGHMVMTAGAKKQPEVVDLNLQPIIQQSEIYSGCYARVNFNFGAYNQAGKRGIGCYLNCIQKLEDGQPLGGGVSASEAFGGNNAIQQTAASGAMPATPYTQVPGYQPQQMAQPPQPQQYVQPQQYGIDPITGQPMMPGGVMGI